MTDKKTQSFYFDAKMVKEIHQEAKRLDRSTRWLIQYAWKLAKAEIAKMPSVPDPKDPTEGKEET